MKYLEIYEGGHPFSNDDLLYLQSAYQEAISNLTKQHGTTYILHGLVRTSTTVEIIPGVPVAAYAYTAGWVVVNNQLMYFAAQTILEASYTTAYIDTAPEDDGDPVLYGDSSTKPIYFKQRAFISASSGAMLLSDFDKMRVGKYAWVTVGGGGTAPAYGSNWVANDNTTVAKNLRYRINNGYLELDGAATYNTSVGVGIFTGPFVIPELFRLPYVGNWKCSVPAYNGSAIDAAMVDVSSNGVISIYLRTGHSFTSNVCFNFSNVRIPLF